MKHQPSIRLFTAILLLLVCIVGCKKDDYLSGGSLHEAVTPLNNMDYLKSNAFKIFDTAVVVIERLGLANQVNSAKTMFAFTDYSILNTINIRLQSKQLANPLATYTLDSLIKDINEDSVRQYLFNETIDLAGAPELKAAPYTSIAKTSMGVLKQLQSVGTYTNMTKAPTFLMYFAKIRGALDEPGVIPPINENDILVLCQTTGIKTSNGTTTLHVLANNHAFVRF